jgi:AbrB family looped-hinge helix DNA binding protein
MGHTGYAAVNAKGQIVIPADIRSRLDIRPGTKIAFLEEKGRLVIQPVTDAFIRSMRGCLAGGNMPRDLDRDPDREL